MEIAPPGDRAGANGSDPLADLGRGLMMERHRRGGAGLPLLELHQAVGALPPSVRRKQWLEREDLDRYKNLGRLLNDMEGVVVAGRMPGLTGLLPALRNHRGRCEVVGAGAGSLSGGSNLFPVNGA